MKPWIPMRSFKESTSEKKHGGFENKQIVSITYINILIKAKDISIYFI
jgi:hypothetical protein